MTVRMAWIVDGLHCQRASNPTDAVRIPRQLVGAQVTPSSDSSIRKSVRQTQRVNRLTRHCKLGSFNIDDVALA